MKFNEPYMAFSIQLIFRKYNRNYVENQREDELQCLNRERHSPFLTKSIFNHFRGQRSTSLQIKDVTWGLCYEGEGVLLNIFLCRRESKIFENRKANAPCLVQVIRHQGNASQKVIHSGYLCSLILKTIHFCSLFSLSEVIFSLSL